MKNTIIYISLLLNLNFKFATGQQLEFKYPAMDDLSVNINCNVKSLNGQYYYDYQINSSEFSNQQIWQIRLNKKSQIDTVFAPHNWNYKILGSESGLLKSIIRWSSNDSTGDIRPGNKLVDFGLISLGLPWTCKYYATGYIPLPIFPLGEEPDIFHNNIFENSFSGISIGPREIFHPISIFKLIDSISVFCDTSYSLGWIKKKSTYQKYKTLLNRAEKALEKGDSLMASFNFYRIIRSTDRDSSARITSEAYALIRYNSEFILEQMPELDPNKIYLRFDRRLNEFFKNGEIYNKGIYKSLSLKLKNSKKKYREGLIESAVRFLNKFQKQVINQKEKHISIECSRYLLDLSKFLIKSIKAAN